jgi:hypothetical protein
MLGRIEREVNGLRKEQIGHDLVVKNQPERGDGLLRLYLSIGLVIDLIMFSGCRKWTC